MFVELYTSIVAMQYLGKPAVTSVGMATVVGAMELFALANLGDPGDFTGPSDVWTDQIAQGCTAIWTTIEQGYADNCANDWVGDAYTSFNSYVINHLKPAAAALYELSRTMSVTLSAISDQITALDIALAVFTLASVVLLAYLFSINVLTGGAGTAAVVAAATEYAVGLLNWVKEVVSLVSAFKAQTNQVRNAANQLAATLWLDIDHQQNRIALPPQLRDYHNWQYNRALDHG